MEGLSDNDNLFRLTDELQRALFTFESTSNQAVMRMYRRSDMMGSLESSNVLSASPLVPSASADSEEPFTLTKSGVDETLFLAYL